LRGTGNAALSKLRLPDTPGNKAAGASTSLQMRLRRLSCGFAPNGTAQIGRIGMKILRAATLAAVSAVVLALNLAAPAFAADPIGTWLTGDKKGKVKIVNCGGAICGSLVWMQEPNDPETNQPKTDKHNSDASKQGRPLIGTPIVLSMKPNGADVWQGQVYNAEDGGTYTGSFTMTGANSADLKGCVMGGLICKSQTWTRSN
jgi:uncharacterized protein (DUF2147 family)